MLKEMDYIYAVYTEKSFSKAAEKLFISQPALSAMVKKVETQVGATLFNRGTTPVSLTPAGEYYIQSAEKIKGIQHEMIEYFNQLAGIKAGRLSIGGGSFFCIYVLPDVVREFKIQYPHLNVNFVEGGSADLAEKLKNGAVDFVLDIQSPNTAAFESVLWGSESLIAVVPSAFAVNEKLKTFRLSFESVRRGAHLSPDVQGIDPQLLADEPFVMLKKGNDSYQRTLTICKKHGFKPQIAFSLDQLLSCYYIVREGKGVAFIRDSVASSVDETDIVCLYKIADDLARRDILLLYRQKGAPLSKVAQDFLDFIRNRNNLFCPPIDNCGSIQ